MSDYRQQQEQDELQGFLWHSLNNLRGHISAEVFQAAEHQLGFNDRRKLNERNEDENQRINQQDFRSTGQRAEGNYLRS